MDSSFGCTEVVLGQIWTEILRLRSIDPNATFVSLGGDSLSAIRCVSRIRQVFGVEVPLEMFFLEGTTLRMMAKAVDSVE